MEARSYVLMNLRMRAKTLSMNIYKVIPVLTKDASAVILLVVGAMFRIITRTLNLFAHVDSLLNEYEQI